jgi:RND family efflux transporter MFP subunit
MSRHNLSAVIRCLQQLTRSAGTNGASDAELLERYIRCRDEAAFELLLWRHGALVFNVCRRMLPCQQDAEDAFQATFLAFTRKASSIRRCGSVASWLYKVAYRVALEARERARKTAAVEKPGGEMLAVPSEADPLWNDVRPILDEELNRLPERLRRPIVLCYLEGKSNAEAAQELGCRLGTIYSRLSRGRELLRRRLQRRGLTLPAAALTTTLTACASEAALTIPLVRTAMRAALAFVDPSATAAVPPHVATLAEGVLRIMFVTKLKIVAVMLLVICVAAGGVLTQARTEAPQAEAKAEDPPPKPAGGDKKDAEPIAVKVVKPKKGGIEVTEKRPADVLAAQQQEIVPLVSGTIKEVRVDIGDVVKKGQVLLVLDAPLLAKEVEEAEATLELARAQVDEAKATVAAAEAEAEVRPAKTDISKLSQARASLNAAKAKVRLAQASLDKARIQESFTQLKAAFDGVVTRRTADAGNYVQPSDSRLLRPLLTVQRVDTLRIVAKVPDGYARFVERGLPVDLEIPGVRITGLKIARFSPTLHNPERDRTMLVEIDYDNTQQHRLVPGMFVAVTIHLKKASPDGLVVPSQCVISVGGQQYVFIVRERKAHRTPITVSVDNGKNAEIAKGIQASDLVITNNQGELSEGTPVKVEKAP